ncbi:MAG TPA: hypothetical protein VNB22_14390 [Pyrinomonadaceae bacterium]|jgi:hypothetical protein|nr:hypothetical protein [Pyrinomonadaceae bacterium]
MKYKITLSIALVISIVMLSLIKSDSTVNAEPPQRFTFDTGIVTLGENQTLRVVSVDGELGGGLYGEVIKRFEYQQTGCEAGICKLAVTSQTTSPVIRFAQNEAASIETPSGGTRRIMIVTDNRNLRVNAIVFDTSTQRVHDTMELESISFN